MKLNLGASHEHVLDGFVNLDKDFDGWRIENGLAYPDNSIEGITISHLLMYVPFDRWPFVFDELYRVLEKNGVVRITEDATDDPASSRHGGFHEAVTLTSFTLVAAHLGAAGLAPAWMPPDGTLFKDDSLLQSWHGKPPKVFYVEGIKP